MTNQDIMYGWYSAKASQMCGTVICINQDRKLVKITHATRDKEGTSYKWDDKKYVGLVSRYRL